MACLSGRAEKRVVGILGLFDRYPPCISRGCAHDAETLPQKRQRLHANLSAAEHSTADGDCNLEKGGERPRIGKFRYVAFVDPSGGSADSFMRRCSQRGATGGYPRCSS
jgi:hypothetical protein